MARHLHPGHLVASCLGGLAEVASNSSVAETLADEALGAARRWGDLAGEALALEQMARVAQAQGDLRRATAQHRQALVLWARIGDPAAMAASLEALGALAVDRDQFTVAARLCGAAEALRSRHGFVRPATRHDAYASIEAKVDQALGDDASAAEWQYGAGLRSTAVVAYATTHAGKGVVRRTSGWEALTPTIHEMT